MSALVRILRRGDGPDPWWNAHVGETFPVLDAGRLGQQYRVDLSRVRGSGAEGYVPDDCAEVVDDLVGRSPEQQRADGLVELTRAGYSDVEIYVALASGSATVTYRGASGSRHSVEVVFPILTTPDLERILAAAARRQARIDAGGLG